MLGSTRRLLNVGGQENQTFYLLFITFFVFTIGLVWSGNAIRAELVTADLDLFAMAQQVSSVMVIIVSVAYTALVDTVAKDRMFIGITLLGMVAIIGAAILLQTGSGDLYETILLLLWVLYIVMFYMWVIHWGTFIIDVYDTRTAKRIYPLLGIARPLGTIVAGLSYGLLTNAIELGGSMLFTVLVAWVVSLALVAVLLVGASILIRRSSSLNVTDAPQVMTPTRQESSLQSLYDGISYLFSSPFVAWMAVSALLVIGLNTLTEYQASEIILEFVADEADPEAAFAEFTAFWEGISNIVAIVLQLFLFNRLMDRLGLRSMVMIYPLMAVSVSTGLVVTPVILVAVLAWININSFRRVFRDPVIGLMGNAVPSRAKGRVRAVINGLISPAGAVIASSLLRLIPVVNASWFLPLLLIVFTVLYLISAVALRREYARAMVSVLEDKSLSFMLSQTKDVDALKMGLTDKERLSLLTQQLEESDDPDFKIFLVQLIAETGGSDAVPIITDLLEAAEDTQYRRQLLETFVKYGEPTRAAQRLYSDLLNDADDFVRALGLQGLEATLGPNNRAYLRVADLLISDPSPVVRAQAVPALLASKKQQHQQNARLQLANLLASDDPEYLMLGINILGASDEERAIASLINYLESPSDEVREAATRAIDKLWQGELEPDVYAQLQRRIPDFLEDPVEDIRLIELQLLGRFKSSDIAESLVKALGDSSERVRRAALSGIIQMGEAALPALERVIEDDDEHREKLVIVALSRIAPQDYQHALENRVGVLLGKLYQNYKRLYALAPFLMFGSVRIIVDALRQENTGLLDEIFLLLQYFGDTSGEEYNLSVVRESLASEDSSVRANALETLEAISTPKITRHMAPIFDPNSTLAQLAQRSSSDDTVNAFDVLFQFAFKDHHSLSTVMLFAFAEIGSIHPDLHDMDRSVLDMRRVQLPKGINLDALAEIDVRRIVVAIRAASSSSRDFIRTNSRAAMRVLNGKTIAVRIKEYKSTGDIDMITLSIVERMIILKKVALFSSVSVDHLQAVATICEERFFDKGEVMFRRGDPGNELFVVVEGTVRIGLHNDSESTFSELATYAENTYFGEMTLFQDLPRSAAAIAHTDVLVLTVRGAVLIGLMREYPDLAVALLRTVSGHLSAMNDRIADLQNQLTP